MKIKRLSTFRYLFLMLLQLAIGVIGYLYINQSNDSQKQILFSAIIVLYAIAVCILIYSIFKPN